MSSRRSVNFSFDWNSSWCKLCSGCWSFAAMAGRQKKEVCSEDSCQRWKGRYAPESWSRKVSNQFSTHWNWNDGKFRLWICWSTQLSRSCYDWQCGLRNDNHSRFCARQWLSRRLRNRLTAKYCLNFKHETVCSDAFLVTVYSCNNFDLHLWHFAAKWRSEPFVHIFSAQVSLFVKAQLHNVCHLAHRERERERESRSKPFSQLLSWHNPSPWYILLHLEFPSNSKRRGKRKFYFWSQLFLDPLVEFTHCLIKLLRFYHCSVYRVPPPPPFPEHFLHYSKISSDSL